MKNILKKIFVSSLLLFSASAYSETQVMNGVDDGTVHINLGHSFPYYGGVFTDAWMSSNGFIILYDPTTGYGNPNTSQSWCNYCPWGYSGGPPDGRSNLSYMIAPMWSDFTHNTNIANSGYFYETGSGGTWFEWRNVQEYGTSNLNTFGLQLWPEGSFDFHYANVNVTQHDTWIGFTGDTTSQSGNVYDEVNQLFYKTASEGGMTTQHVTNFTDATTNFGYAWWGQDGGYDSAPAGPDCSNPLNDTSCEGYEQAYFDQQCSANALYDSQCPGYQQAYYNQQCGLDALYDSGCPGYAEAYFDQQCGLDSLYDQECPGYAEAYYNQQCGLDALYDSGCPGYAEAYFDQQCGLDALYDTQCPGYAEAWLDKECEKDSLFSQSCPNYQIAKQQEELTQLATADTSYNEDKIENGFTDEYREEDVIEMPIEAEVFIEDPVEEFEEPILQPVAEVIEEQPVIDEIEDTPVEVVSEPEPVLVSIEPVQEEVNLPIEIEAEVEVESKVVAPVEKVEVEKVAAVEPAPVKELNISKQSSIQIALDVVEQERKSSDKRLSESISSSTQQDSTFESSDEVEQVYVTTNTTNSVYQNDVSNDDTQIQNSDVVVDVVQESSMIVVDYSNSDQSDVVIDVAEDSIMSVASTSEQQDDVLVEAEQETFSTTDLMFDTQVSEAFSTGANISVVLSGARPDFSKFDVKPPTKQQAVDTKKVESLAEQMSATTLKQNLDQLQQNVQESGGFEDQTVAVVLINYVPGFYESSTQSLASKGDWYTAKSIYKNKGNVDNTMTLYMMAGQTEQKHKQMVLEQYGR